MIQIIMQVMFFKIFRKILLQNKTFTAIAFYYDQPLMLIWTKFDNKLFGFDVYAIFCIVSLFQIIMQIKSLTKVKMGKRKDLTEEERVR